MPHARRLLKFLARRRLQQLARRAVSIMIIGAVAVMVLLLVALMVIVDVAVADLYRGPFASMLWLLPTVLYSAAIPLLNGVYLQLARRLTSWEVRSPRQRVCARSFPF